LGLRLVVGLTFAVHGARTLFGAFGGAGIEGTARFSEQIDLRPGKPNAWLSGVAELFAGLLLALGLVMPVAAAALIGDMTAAVLTVHLRNGFLYRQRLRVQPGAGGSCVRPRRGRRRGVVARRGPRHQPGRNGLGVGRARSGRPRWPRRSRQRSPGKSAATRRVARALAALGIPVAHAVASEWSWPVSGRTV
jgi:putative oxidoreductase